MLTPDQVKNLKPGDKLVVQGEFCQAYNNGNILVSLSVQRWETSIREIRSFHPSCVSLPSDSARTFCHVVDNMVKPKYDPTRPYQKGDRARVVERNGRTPTCFPVGRIKVGDIVTVAENEAGDMFIKVLTEDGHEMMVPWFMLDLVTPVEELEPYSIDPTNTNVLFKRGKKFATFEDDDEAQEMCDRLNAEHRKEQK
jgi:hypothetical protein